MVKNYFPNARMSHVNHDVRQYLAQMKMVSDSMAHTYCTEKMMLKIDKDEDVELFAFSNPKLELNHYKYNDTQVWHFLSGIKRMSKFTLYFYYITITEKNGEWHLREHGPVTISEVPPCDHLKDVIYDLVNYTKQTENRRIKEELVSI